MSFMHLLPDQIITDLQSNSIHGVKGLKIPQARRITPCLYEAHSLGGGGRWRVNVERDKMDYVRSPHWNRHGDVKGSIARRNRFYVDSSRDKSLTTQHLHWDLKDKKKTAKLRAGANLCLRQRKDSKGKVLNTDKVCVTGWDEGSRDGHEVGLRSCLESDGAGPWRS